MIFLGTFYAQQSRRFVNTSRVPCSTREEVRVHMYIDLSPTCELYSVFVSHSYLLSPFPPSRAKGQRSATSQSSWPSRTCTLTLRHGGNIVARMRQSLCWRLFTRYSHSINCSADRCSWQLEQGPGPIFTESSYVRAVRKRTSQSLLTLGLFLTKATSNGIEHLRQKKKIVNSAPVPPRRGDSKHVQQAHVERA